MPTNESLCVAFCMGRGSCPTQQDAIWINDKVFQQPNHASSEFRLEADTLFIVADGVAVSPSAARASKLAVRALAESVKAHADWSFDGMIAARHVRAAQQRMCEALEKRTLDYGASTTIVAVQLRGNELAMVNTGDSRAYLLRRDGTIRMLSRDHTEKQKLLDEGTATEGTDYASVYDSLSDCLIADPEAEGFAVHRETATLQPGERVILCSDGVHDVFDESDWLAAMVQEATPLSMAAETRRRVLLSGAPDNFSVVTLKMRG